MSVALRWDLTTRDVPGIGRVAFVQPVVSESMGPELREAIALRRIATIEGRCPCGAVLYLPNREARRKAKRDGRQLHATVQHEPSCDATDDRIIALVRGEL